MKPTDPLTMTDTDRLALWRQDIEQARATEDWQRLAQTLDALGAWCKADPTGERDQLWQQFNFAENNARKYDLWRKEAAALVLKLQSCCGNPDLFEQQWNEVQNWIALNPRDPRHQGSDPEGDEDTDAQAVKWAVELTDAAIAGDPARMQQAEAGLRSWLAAAPAHQLMWAMMGFDEGEVDEANTSKPDTKH